MLATQPISRMTATEIVERHEEKLLMIGPVIERLHNELLEPLIDRTFAYLVKANALPPAPPELQGMDLSVEFVSILAQAQQAKIAKDLAGAKTGADQNALTDVMNMFSGYQSTSPGSV